MQIAAAQMATPAADGTVSQAQPPAEISTPSSNQGQFFDQVAQMQLTRMEADNELLGGPPLWSHTSMKATKSFLDDLKKDQNYTEKARRERKQQITKENEAQDVAILEQPKHLGPAGQVLEPSDWQGANRPANTHAMTDMLINYLDRQSFVDLIFNMEKSIARSLDTLIKGQ